MLNVPWLNVQINENVFKIVTYLKKSYETSLRGELTLLNIILSRAEFKYEHDNKYVEIL